MTHIKIAVAGLAFWILIPFANAHTVTPGQFFPSDLLNVYAPNSKGWSLVGSSKTAIGFGRRGSSANESYVAQVTLFKLSESKDRDEFVALIKHGVETDTPPDRFKSYESSYDYTEERGYPCVKYYGVAEDTKAKTSPSSREQLKLQIYSLYCRHPARHDTGFVIGYSHRGVSLDAELGVQAQAFMDGIQVPTK